MIPILCVWGGGGEGGWANVVGIVAALQAIRPRNRGSIPGGEKRFITSPTASRQVLGPTHPVFFLGGEPGAANVRGKAVGA